MPRPGKNWLALDCNYFDDPDVAELSDGAQLLDLKAMTLAKRLQSDGRLTRRQLVRLAPDSPAELIGELVGCGLWIEGEERLERRTWLMWNDSAESIEAVSRGGKLGNHVKWHVKGKKPPSAKCEFCIAEGLISPPSRGAISGRVAGRIADTDVDTDGEEDTYAPQQPPPGPASGVQGTRAIAEVVAERVATVDEAKSALEADGHDERTITAVLALMPSLKRSAS